MQYFRASLPAVAFRDGAQPAPGSRVRRGAGRLAMVAFALLSLGGCASLSSTGAQTMRLMFSGGPRLEVDPRAIADSPYARMRIEGAGLRAVAVLGNDDAGVLSWYGDPHRLVLVRDGLLVGTAGLAVNVDEIRIEGDNPFDRLARIGVQPVQLQRRYDWRDGYRYGVEVRGLLQRRDLEKVEILGQTRELVRYEEVLSGPGVHASNEYWADPQTGFIWKSRQLVAPGTMLELVVLKPYRAGSR